MTDSCSGGVPEARDVDVGERAEPDALSPGAAERGRLPEKVRRRQVSWQTAVAAVIAVLLLVVLGLIELIGQSPAQPDPAPHAPGG